MESILPSEIARLVYGYLLSEGCNDAAQRFMITSPHLHECQGIINQGRKFNTRFHGRNLMQILDLFTNIYSLVQDNIQRMGQAARGETEETLMEQLCQLLELSNSFSKSNNSNSYRNSLFQNIIQDEANEKSRQGSAVRRRLLEPGASSQEICRSSSPGTSRIGKDDSQPDDAVDFVLYNLLDNTELHEKLAEKINKVIATPEKESSVPGTDAIKTIVKETEEDPWIQGLISGIINASAENEDRTGIIAGDTEEDFRGTSELQKKTNENVEDKSLVPIKQRLRSSKAKSQLITVNGLELEENTSSADMFNCFGNSKNGKSKKQKGNDDKGETNETERTQSNKACLLETAMSNCDINQSPEQSAPNSGCNTEGTSFKGQSDSSHMGFCFVDVNEVTHVSPQGSPHPESAISNNHDNLGTSSVIVVTDSYQTPNTSATHTSFNSQTIFSPRIQNTTVLTLPSPLFGSGSIFTVIPPVATSTPASSKYFSAVVISEDPLKVPNSNIFTENDVAMAIPVSSTPVRDCIPIIPKPTLLESDAEKKTKKELLCTTRRRGQHWRKGLKGNIRKTVRVPRKGTVLEAILPNRPPIRNLKNVPHQKLVNGVEIEVLDGLTFNTPNTGLPAILEISNEDLTTEKITADNGENEHINENLVEKHIEQDIQSGNPDLCEDLSSMKNKTPSEKDCSVQKNENKTNETKSGNKSEKDFIKDNEKGKSYVTETPGPATKKKLSLSTPRRRNSHIRALDFNTPKKNLTRKSNTSPKRIVSPKKSFLNNIKRSKLFKSPTLSQSSANNKKEQELIFKSPISKDPVPIATLSPAQTSLKGDWEKVNGVQVIINQQSENENISSKCKSNLWDSSLRALISGEYRDPSPPKKSQSKKVPPLRKTQSKKKLSTPKKTQSKKKLSLKKKMGKRNTPFKVTGQIRRRAVEKNVNELEEKRKLEDILPHKTTNDVNVRVMEKESNTESNVKVANKDDLSEKSVFVQNNLTELNNKLTDSTVSQGLESDKDKQSEKRKNSDNEGLLMSVEDEENNVLDSSTMSESVLGLRIEENLRNVNEEDSQNRDKNECSSSEVINVSHEEKAAKIVGNQIEIRIDTVESEKCTETKVQSSTVITDAAVVSNLKVDTNFTIPVTLLTNDSLYKHGTLGTLPDLETPAKLDFEGLVPKTPYLDTPMLKTIRENTSVLSSDQLLTPSLPATPYQDGRSNSCSTPLSKGNLEEVLIQECKQMKDDNNVDGNVKKSTIGIRNDKKHDESELKKQSIKTKVETSPKVKKSPVKKKKLPPQKSSPESKNSTQSKRKAKAHSNGSKVSKSEGKQKKKNSEKWIEKFLKQAKEELFGDDLSSSEDEIFEKKINKKNISNSIYTQVYTDDSSVDRNKSVSPKKVNSSPKKLKKTKSYTFIDDSDSDSNETHSINKIKQRTLNKNATSPDKNKVEVGISFSTSDLVSDSMEKLVEKSQSLKKLDSVIPQKLTSVTKAVTHPDNLQTLFTPTKSPLSQKENVLKNPVKSPCPIKSKNLNDLADKLARRKSTDNNKDFPSLHLSPDSFNDDIHNLCKTSNDMPEVRHFPLSNNSKVLTSRQTTNTKNNEELSLNKKTFDSNPIRKNETIFLSKNETFTTIVFDEINFKPKPVVRIDNFDNFQVDIVVDVNEGGKETSGILSVQPLQILLDISPNTEFNILNVDESNKEIHNNLSLQPLQILMDITPNKESKLKQTPLKTNETIRESSSNRSDKNSQASSRSKHRGSRERSVHKWRDTPPRTMEYTRRSDGKRRIKPIRIDDHEYEARLRRNEYERPRNERHDSGRRSRSSARYSRDKSRTRREDDDRIHSHKESSRFHERSRYNRRKSNNYDKYNKGEKYNGGPDQKVEESDRRTRQNSVIKSPVVCSEERPLVSYQDKEEETNMTEDELMNIAVTSGSSLTSSRQVNKRRGSQETESSPRKLPPKKRKASSDERPSENPVKKIKDRRTAGSALECRFGSLLICSARKEKCSTRRM